MHTQAKPYDLNISVKEAEGASGRETLVARVFGQVVAHGLHKIEYYHSDLARDTMWLLRNIDDMLAGTTFYWSFRQCGSSLGFDEKLVKTDASLFFEVKVTVEHKYGNDYLMLHITEGS